MNRYYHLLLVFLALTIFACQKSEENVKNSDEVKDIIAQKWARYIEAAIAKYA